MTETTLYQKAHALAHQAHQGQVDKGGAPYIGHPLRVAEACETQDEKIVALLHDVVEDCDWTIDTLREHFPDRIIQAVAAISRIDGEKFWDYIYRCRRNDLARRVKIRDLYDNMDISRVEGTDAESMIRGMTKTRYKPALELLTKGV